MTKTLVPGWFYHISVSFQALVIEMQAQLTNYEKNKEQVNHILKYWDRTKGMLLVPLPEKEAQPEKKVSLMSLSPRREREDYSTSTSCQCLRPSLPLLTGPRKKR